MKFMKKFAEARLTTNIGRIGGFERNFTNTAFEKLEKFLAEYPKTLKEFDNLLRRNRIFMDRTIGCGPISGERALNYGFTGPNLRAAGVDYDVRVHTPYSSYQDFNFTVPVGSTGDCYDRFLVRQDEMWQSIEIIKQAYQKVQEFKGAEAEVFMLIFRHITCLRKKMCTQKWRRSSTTLKYHGRNGNAGG
jgi:NADH-quinone oxidoreductase subunit D